MPFITINQGGPEGAVADGVYIVILVDIAKEVRVVEGMNGPTKLRDWTFAVDDGPEENKTIVDSTTTAAGPKSKQFGWITALLGGKPPMIGQNFEPEDLIGRRALATVRRNEQGWPKIENLGALPAAMLQQSAAKALSLQPAAAPAARPVAQPVAATGDDLPF